MQLLRVGCCAAVLLSVAQADAAPKLKGFHPIKAIKAKWRKERALVKLERVVRAKPRLAVKFRERYGKLGGKRQFGTRGEWAMMTIGTAVNIGGVVDPEHMIHYLVASTVVNLGTVARHVFSIKRMRRKTIISMVEDGTISNTDLKPFRDALGLRANGRRLTPKPKPAEPTEPTPAAEPVPDKKPEQPPAEKTPTAK
jgi:hypothetical protein